MLDLQKTTPSRKSIFAFTITISLIAIHTFLVFRQFPLSSIVEGNLPVKGDVARYLASVEGVYRIGGCGYDTMAMAGYPVGTWNSIGKKGYELLGYCMPTAPLGVRFYLILVGISLVQPLLYELTNIIIMKGVPKWIVLTISLSIWHFDGQVAFFWSFGNVLSPSTCLLLPSALALAWRCTFLPFPILSTIGLGLVSAWFFYAHTAIGIALVCPIAIFVLRATYTRVSLKPLFWISSAAILAIVCCSPWMVELFNSRSDCIPQPQQWFQAGPKHFLADVLSDRGYARPFDRKFFLHFTTVAGIAGMFIAKKNVDTIPVLIGACGLWCLVIAYTFSYISVIKAVQPYRFLVPAVICLPVPACIAMWEAIEIWKVSPRPSQILIACLALIILPAFTAHFLDLNQLALDCGLTRDERNVLIKLKGLPGKNRIVCQLDTVGHLIPLCAEKPVIGGLNDQAFIKQRFVGMNEAGSLFGSPQSEWDPSALKWYFEAYSAEYAIFSTGDWITYAKIHPDLFELIGNYGRFALYRFKGDVGYFAEGSGSVTVEKDRILLNTKENWVVLKFHYSELLKAPQGVTLVPVVVVGDDPTPFLGVKNPNNFQTIELRCR